MYSLVKSLSRSALLLKSVRISSEKGIHIRKPLQLLAYSKQDYSTESAVEKYRSKLLTKARERGFETVEEFLESSKEDTLKKKKEFNKIDPLKELENYEQRVKMSENNAGLTTPRGPVDPNSSTTPFKTFDSFLKLDKIKDLSKQEIEFLWRARWMAKDNALCAVVPIEIYSKIISNVKQNPAFVLPLPRMVQGEDKAEGEQSVELHYIQWQFVGPRTTHCIITSLAEYKLHNEYAKPHTILQFHSELAKDKKCIFMNGEVEPNTNISVQDAQLLLLNIQRFYGAMGEITPVAKKRVQLLRDFTQGSPDFKVDSLISLAQSMEN